ncbi:MAG: Amuc_1098 family type IV pilus outer membrane protein [Chthoniobacterales bacterium]
MNRLLSTLTAVCMFVAISQIHAGSTGQATTGGIENLSDREITRRQENILLAEQALKRSETELQRNNIEAAYNEAKQAVDLLPDGSSARSLRARALSRFSSTSVRYAEYLVSQGEYAKAAAVANEVLEPRYNPNYRPAAVFLDRLNQPDYFNKAITTELAAERTQVGTLINEAVGLYDSGRYDLAQKRYQQVLEIDKYNATAFRGLEQVELGKQRYYDSAYNETRSRMLWQVEKAWERPKRRFSEARTTDSAAGQEERRGTELMVARLNRIIIPRIDFRDATIRQAVTFLQQQSRTSEASGAPGDGASGINIVLKLPRSGAVAPPVTDEFGEAAAPGAVPPADSRITLNLTNVPLYEALRYVATLAGLKVKVEPFAVSIVPLSELTDTLEQREFKVPPGFITGTGGEADPTVFAGRAADDEGGPRLAVRQNARDFLESQGVAFPPGASANFIPGSSRLVVRNTAPNLDLIESLVDAAMGEQPTQVEIEAKFVEVTQNNLKELGFDWTLGPFSVGGSGVYGGGGSTGADGRAYPFVYPGTSVPVGVNTVTQGLRTGSGTQPYSALSVNSINALLARSLGVGTAGAPTPGIFSIAGVFTNPQFQVVIRALNQRKGVDLMAAPKVTTKSGQKATITISREFPYPQEFEPPQIPQSTSGGAIVAGGGGQNRADPVVTPSFPTDFTTRNLGVTLEVEPQIGPDGYTIDLNLSPEVVDFDGFINYGSPISVPIQSLLGQNLTSTTSGDLTVFSLIDIFSATTPRILTENVINQPIFSTRKVTTNVSIWDGQTVALGGLIREDVQKINDKVPILGDIPLAGALFRSEVEQKIKSNLIVFVTARLMDAAGQLLRPEDDSDQEEIVEPLGLPPELPRPASGVTAKGFRQK